MYVFVIFTILFPYTLTSYTGDKSKPEFQGSYYVLEVGNFDPIGEPPVVSPPSSASSVTSPTHAQAGYYMLDLQNFDGDGESSKVTTTKRSSSSVRYENITPSTATPTRGSRETTPEARLPPDSHMVAKATTPPPLGQDGIQRATVYENVIISALGVPEPVIPVEHPYVVPAPTANLSSSAREPPRPPRADGRGFVAGPVEDESGYTLIDDLCRKKLGPGGIIVSTRVPDCYEQCKVNEGQLDDQSDQVEAQASSTNPTGSLMDTPLSDGHVTQSPKKSPSRRREEVYEAVKVGGANSSQTQPMPAPHVHVNGTSETHGDRTQPPSSSSVSNSSSLEASGIIDNSRDNPFAGLVLSNSRQLEESLPQVAVAPPPGRQQGVGVELGAGRFRGRVDTVWDDVRMEKEWTKVLILCS